MSLATLLTVACGGLFCMNQPVDQAGEKILFATDGKTVTAHVQIQYQGPAAEFSWVVPVPSEPKLGLGADALFRVLDDATAPRFQVEPLTDDGCTEGWYPSNPTMMASAPAPSGASVDLVSREQVGPYDAAVIRSNDPAALKAWLRDNRYVIPGAIDPMLDPYVAGGYYFIALKLRKDREAGELAPIAFTYAATKPGVPIRLTGVAATPDMGVKVWVLAKDRAVPENYRHATIDECRIDWLRAGANYDQVVTAAMDEAGGQAFVTDYAGPSEAVRRDPFDVDAGALQALRQATTPAALAEAAFTSGAFGRSGQTDTDAMLAFLRRHAPVPAGVEVPEAFYYSSLVQGRTFLPPGTPPQIVDGAKAAAELEAERVPAIRAIRTMLGAHRTLTRLYTTMSPAEMTQDPMFVLNAALPPVSNVHRATIVRRCTPGVAPQDWLHEVSLADGTRYTTTSSAAGTPLLALPAAGRIEQMKAEGAPSLIQDNGPAIRRALHGAGALLSPLDAPSAAPSPTAAVGIDPVTGGAVAVPAKQPAAPKGGGFGCAGCSSPPAAPVNGAGEGLTFALFAAGWFAWRRRGG